MFSDNSKSCLTFKANLISKVSHIQTFWVVFLDFKLAKIPSNCFCPETQDYSIFSLYYASLSSFLPSFFPSFLPFSSLSLSPFLLSFPPSVFFRSFSFMKSNTSLWMKTLFQSWKFKFTARAYIYLALHSPRFCPHRFNQLTNCRLKLFRKKTI